MAKFIKVTDEGNVGYHSVDDDWEPPPIVGKHEKYEEVSETVARKNHPLLFGPPKEAAEPAKSTK